MKGHFNHLLENPRGLSWSWRIKDAKCCFIPGQRNSNLAIHRKTYIPKYCPVSWPHFPPHFPHFSGLWSPETEDGARACPAFHREKKHFGMQGLLHQWTSQAGKWGFSSWPCLWVSLTLGLSAAAPKCCGDAFEERHVRPWLPLLRGSIWLQLPTLECRAAIFGAEGSRGRTNRTLFTH